MARCFLKVRQPCSRTTCSCSQSPPRTPVTLSIALEEQWFEHPTKLIDHVIEGITHCCTAFQGDQWRCDQTVRNRLHEGRLYARRPMVCIPLTPRHRAARRRWTAEHRDWEQHDWSQVLFTDESQFSLECDTRRVLV
ncbi:transposable element Tcb2 transposase [Trichonephila clavipes]|nr:transposable element Tcb2 transposase [Trichonephila clavipes]